MPEDKTFGDLLMEISKPHTSAWRAGYAAYGLGKPRSPRGPSGLHDEWLRGFDHARAVGRAAIEAVDRFDADNP